MIALVKAIAYPGNGEMSGIKRQVFRRFYISWIENASPMFVTIPGCTDVYLSLHFHFQFIVER